MQTHRTLLEVSQVSKRFRTRRHPSRLARLRFGQSSPEDFVWALRDVSLTVAEGQILGLIGRNGSGKTTLLRLISGIYVPTSGSIRVRGRMSSLIELGAGFHPDLSGMENIFLYGAVLGMRRAEVARNLESIISFAELSEFIHQPIRTYSLGMFLRLAMATALCLNPDLLLIDEALGVGDVAFQQKCFARIYELKQQGKAIVFVSHNMALIRHLSTEVAWLDHGRISAFGKPDEVVVKYLEHLKVAPVLADERWGPGGALINRRRWGNGKVRIDRVLVLDDSGKESYLLASGKPARFRFHISSPGVSGFGLLLQLFLSDGTYINGPRIFHHPEYFAGNVTVDFAFDALPFVRGQFMFSVFAYDPDNIAVPSDAHEFLYEFSVLDEGDVETPGYLKLPARWEVH
ncbi:MAG: ABC transporter ATP-binding protein [bacterium JZ-2024 1]